MNYIDVKEACEKTNKSEKTIRRLFSKEDSKPFLKKSGNKNLIEVNYLFSIYEPVKQEKKRPSQKLDMTNKSPSKNELYELKTKIALYEQEIRLNKSLHEQELKNKELLLQEKEGRILDLQKTILLLEAPKKEVEILEQKPIEKKKKWWHF
jgi:outer membrane receptor for monomeric catechols